MPDIEKFDKGSAEMEKEAEQGPSSVTLGAAGSSCALPEDSKKIEEDGGRESGRGEDWEGAGPVLWRPRCGHLGGR